MKPTNQPTNQPTTIGHPCWKLTNKWWFQVTLLSKLTFCPSTPTPQSLETSCCRKTPVGDGVFKLLLGEQRCPAKNHPFQIKRCTRENYWKLTWHWKIPGFNRKYTLKWWMFDCHVSFRGCSFPLGEEEYGHPQIKHLFLNHLDFFQPTYPIAMRWNHTKKRCLWSNNYGQCQLKGWQPWQPLRRSSRRPQRSMAQMTALASIGTELRIDWSWNIWRFCQP